MTLLIFLALVALNVQMYMFLRKPKAEQPQTQIFQPNPPMERLVFPQQQAPQAQQPYQTPLPTPSQAEYNGFFSSGPSGLGG